MDEIHTLTDKNLRELEKRLSREYSEAQRELDEKFWKYMQDFQRKDREKAAQLAAGEITKDEYLKWRMGQALSGERWRKMRDDMTQRLVNADRIAADMINGTLPRTYTDNLNYGVFEAEKASSLRTSFELVDEDTMRRLMRDDPEIIPTVKPDIPKDMRWNRQKITSAMTQGILQGESIPKIARRLQSVTDMDKRAAIRNARTYTTAAENGGRIDGYKRAKDMGIEMEQEWLAALDSRTRSEHRQLDGVKVAVGEPWEIDGYKIRYPGDPEAAPHLIYNCRCTVVAALKELDDTAEERWSKLPEGQTYSEWKSELVRKKNTTSGDTVRTVVNGKDLSATWVRRKDEFAFEIEDVINAQGFDGLPRVVSPDEFDRYVEESNFIAQRTYSAPDKETLDAYKKTLYEGKWYVDCSKGGAAYGQGMYCAGNYEGKLTDDIKQEMLDYQKHNLENLKAGNIANIETMTLDKSARIVDYNQLVKMQESEGRKDTVIARYIKNAELSDSDMSYIYEKYGKEIERTGVFDYDYIKKISDMSWNNQFEQDSDTYYAHYDESMERFLNAMGVESERDFEKMAGVEANKLYELRRMDLGSYAALKGYDAIRTDRGKSGADTVVLNRTKLIIREGG